MFRCSSTKVILVGLLVLSAAYRIGIYVFADPIISSDGVLYVTLGQNFWNGLGYVDTITDSGIEAIRRPPLYAMFAGFANLLIGNPELAGRLLSLLCNLIVIAQLYHLVSLMFNERAALWSAVVAAVDINLVLSSCDVGPESLFLCLFLWFVTLLWQMFRQPVWWRLPLVAFSIALMYLTRVEGLAYSVVAIGWIAYTYYRKRPVEEVRKTIGGVVLACVALAVPAGGYVSFLHARTGQWMLSGNIDIGLRYGLEMAGLDEEFEESVGGDSESAESFSANPSLLGAVLRAPDVMLRLYWTNLSDAAPNLLRGWWPLILLVVLGWGSPGRRNRVGNQAVLLGLVILIPFLIVPILPIPERLLRQVTVTLLLATGISVDMLAAWLREQPPESWHYYLMYALASCVIIFVVLHVRVAVVYNDQMYDQRLMGQWMSEHGITGKRLMAGKVWPAFYSNSVYVRIPDVPLDSMVTEARRRNVDYFVIDTRYAVVRRPQIEPMMQDSIVAALGLCVVHEISTAAMQRVRLIRVSGAEPDASTEDTLRR